MKGIQLRENSERKPATRQSFHILVFLIPATTVYTLFMIYPLLDSLRLGFYEISIKGDESFVGLRNYITLLTNPLWSTQLLNALRNNFLFFIVHMLVQNPLALLLAALLTSHGQRSLYRTLIFIPTIISVVLVGFIWQLILSPLWGIASGILKAVQMGQLFRPWLGLESTALVTLSLISVWQWVGIPMMLFYTALLSIPEELTEAAKVDGANAWNTFWRIKFPLILPVVAIVSILTFIGNFNAFDLIYTLKGNLAGPNYAADVMGTFFHRTFFGSTLQIGNPSMGTSVAMVMFLIILSGVLLYYVWQRRIETYEL